MAKVLNHIILFLCARLLAVMCTTVYLPTKLPPTRSKTRGRNSVRIATGAAGYGTALWLSTMGYREPRQSGSIEVAVHARSMTYLWKHAARRGRFLPKITKSGEAISSGEA